MSLFLKLAFLFCIGSLSGWVLEVFYRRFFSDANPERKWINPGFCKGPYVPLYGEGLCILYLLAMLESFHLIQNPIWNRVGLFISMAIGMTVLEYVIGYITLKYANVRLWDYRNEWGNIQGLICPKFSMYWSILGAMYYFLIHPHILDSLEWLARNLGFSFGIGLFFGIFGIDFVESSNMLMRVREFAKENNIIVRYEELKVHIRKQHELRKLKYHFFSPLQTVRPLSEHLKELKEEMDKNITELKFEVEEEIKEIKEEVEKEVKKVLK